jgi:hypothetical protein
MWSSLEIVNEHGKPVRPPVRETVARVLADAGLHASLDDSGVRVPEGEERLAREVLLTDDRLVGSGAIVILAVPAGTGRKTAAAFEVPEVAPDEPMRIPMPRGTRYRHHLQRRAGSSGMRRRRRSLPAVATAARAN